MSAVNLKDKLALFSEHWSPRIVADFNGHDVMVVKVKGEFNWHSHPDTDDFSSSLRARSLSNFVTGMSILAKGNYLLYQKGWSTARLRSTKPSSCSLNHAVRQTRVLKQRRQRKLRFSDFLNVWPSNVLYWLSRLPPRILHPQESRRTLAIKLA